MSVRSHSQAFRELGFSFGGEGLQETRGIHKSGLAKNDSHDSTTQFWRLLVLETFVRCPKFDSSFSTFCSEVTWTADMLHVNFRLGFMVKVLQAESAWQPIKGIRLRVDATHPDAN